MTRVPSDRRTDRGVVVVGIDFSELSEGVLRVAAGMVALDRAVELHMIHVLSSYAPPKYAPPNAPTECGIPSASINVRARLTELGTRIGHTVTRLHVHVREGKPEVEIARLAGDVRADLIVIGSRRRRPFARLFGSTADRLVSYARCPVLTFHSRATSLGPQTE